LEIVIARVEFHHHDDVEREGDEEEDEGGDEEAESPVDHLSEWNCHEVEQTHVDRFVEGDVVGATVEIGCVFWWFTGLGG
jgi:hypothetical protein